MRCEHRGPLKLMAHRPIVIDGAAGVESGLSNDYGGDGDCVDQVVELTAPPRPGARDKDAVRHRVVDMHFFTRWFTHRSAPPLHHVGIKNSLWRYDRPCSPLGAARFSNDASVALKILGIDFGFLEGDFLTLS